MQDLIPAETLLLRNLIRKISRHLNICMEFSKHLHAIFIKQHFLSVSCQLKYLKRLPQRENDYF